MKYDFDCVIVGAGIAGMTAAIYLKRANVNVCIIDFDAPGGLLNNLKTIENYPGYSKISGPDLALNIFNQVKDLGINIKYGRVLKIDDQRIITDIEELTAKKIIIATGRPAKRLHILDNLANVSYCAICDGSLYKNKTVAVIGESKLAYGEANYLADICKKVYVINSKETENKDLEEISLKENIENTQAVIKDIEKSENTVTAILTDQDKFNVDGVFVCIGYEPKTDFIQDIELEKGFIVVDENMCTANTNIYACGDIIKKEIYQLTTAAAEGTIAAINVKKNLNDK